MMKLCRILTEGVVVAVPDAPDQHIFSEGVWGNSRTCRTLIIQLDGNKNNTNRALRYDKRTIELHSEDNQTI